MRPTACSVSRVNIAFVLLYALTQGRRRAGHDGGHCLPALFEGEQRGRRCLFITVSQVISWFIKIDLNQICCSYSRTHKIHIFLIISVVIFEVNLVAEQKEVYW